MSREADIIAADIISTELSLPAGRVVVGLENFDSPKDSSLYVIVMTAEARILSANNFFDADSNEEVKQVVMYGRLNVEAVSRGREAMERKEEIVAALKSQYAENLLETEQARIFRVGDIQDLSAVEGASALKRYRIPVIMSYMKTYKKTVDIYENFPEEENTE